MSSDLGEATEGLENEQSSFHSPAFSSLHLCHSSFSNPSVALPTSQLILQHFRCFTYVTAHSRTLLSLLLCHRLLTYVTWLAAQAERRTSLLSSSQCRGCVYVDPCIHIAREPSWLVIGILLPLVQYEVQGKYDAKYGVSWQHTAISFIENITMSFSHKYCISQIIYDTKVTY